MDGRWRKGEAATDAWLWVVQAGLGFAVASKVTNAEAIDAMSRLSTVGYLMVKSKASEALTLEGPFKLWRGWESLDGGCWLPLSPH
jgi:hypothetical protein